MLIGFKDDTKQRNTVNATDDRIKIGNDHDRLKCWQEISEMKFNWDKCQSAAFRF